MMESTTDLLQIEHFSLSFLSGKETNKVVEDLSFVLQKGKTLGIVGESGSGKSVSMLSMMRLFNDKKVKYEGTIRFCDNTEQVDLLSLSENMIRHYRGNRIAMIFQEPMTSLNPSMRCGNQITEVLRLHAKMSKKAARQKALSLLQEVMLPDTQKIFMAYPHEISGGQKQRVMIAMAMACQPDVLIADEPTTALDVTVQKGIIDLMKNLQKKYGMSIIFITHDLGVVAQIADEVLVMYKGRKVEQNNIKEIFSNPQHNYTKGLLACRVPLYKRWNTLPSIADFMQEKTQQAFVKQEITPEEWKRSAEKLMQKQPLLQVKNLSKYYPLKKKLFHPKTYYKAIDNISFEVYEGETLGLVGESGCGKTTLGRSLLRLIEPTCGQIIYQNVNICKLSETEMRQKRKDMQIIFQDPYSSLNPRFTIGNAIMEPMQMYHLYDNDKHRKEKVMDLLEKVGLQEKHFYAYPHQFSGGQRQRICIARALALNPKFVICDESVSALDVSVQAQVLNLLNDLKKEFNLTYIFISHDLSVVKYMSHRVMVMCNGKIQEMNFADDLYTCPQTEYTKELITAIPKIKYYQC